MARFAITSTVTELLGDAARSTISETVERS